MQDAGAQRVSPLIGTDAMTPIELAMNELTETISTTTEYRENPEKKAPILRAYMQAIQEDMEMLGSFEIADPEMQRKVTQLVIAARRLKRHVERDALDIEIRQAEQAPTIELIEASSKNKQDRAKFAPLKLPQFDGKASEFKIFAEFYEENILNNEAITDTTKWMRLDEMLKGKAAELLSTMPRRTGTIETAWKLLKETYGGDQKPIVELYQQLQSLPAAPLCTAALRMTYSKLEGILLALELMQHDVNENHYIKWVALSKFPADIMYKIQDTAEMTLKQIRQALQQIIAAREMADRQNTNPNQSCTCIVCNPPNIQRTSKQQQSTTYTNPAKASKKQNSPLTRSIVCLFCTKQHWSDECPEFTTVQTRKEKIKDRCYKCLRQRHTEPCSIERKCFHCGSTDHNRALCPSKFGDQGEAPLISLAALQSVCPYTAVQRHTGYLMTFVAQVVSHSQIHPQSIRVALDTGGGSTVATKQLMQRLRIPCNTKQYVFRGLNNTNLNEITEAQECVTLIAQNGKKITIPVYVVDTIANDVPVPNIQQFKEQNPSFVDTHIPETGEGTPIDLLIGADVMVDCVRLHESIPVDENTQLLASEFGYLIMGRQRQSDTTNAGTILLTIDQNPLKQMTELELIGLKDLSKTEIEEEEEAISTFYRTLRFENNRYSISWPWRHDPPHLNTNFGLAYGRLKTLHRRLSKEPQLLQKYDEIIQQQLEAAIIEKTEKAVQHSGVEHYLPHHPIIQPGKSTALRLVYDGSAKPTQQQRSLNEVIHKGTNWITDILATLLRFRQHSLAVTADIAKAFHQVAINADSRDAVRFLWLKNINREPVFDNIQIYRFKRVAFGIVASPFILSATIKHHAKQKQVNEFIDIILRDLYADNLVSSLPAHTNLLGFYTYAKQFFEEMSMNLTKWGTNDQRLREKIPSEDQQQGRLHNVLGLSWDVEADTLRIKQVRLQQEKEVTCRVVARQMAAHFDPLGWAAPIVLTAKNFFRHIWENTKKWDEALPSPDAENWIQLLKQLQKIGEIEIPRKMYNSHSSTNIQLHAFVDASVFAYAAVVYIRAIENENTHTSIVIAKTRLTPKQKLSIPKLELAAIVLGAKLIAFLKRTFTIQIQRTFIWSDSKCALAWVKQNKILPVIIEKYVQQIKTYHIDEFRYVSTTQNYADVATRGATFSSLVQLNWWIGPTWLQHENNWPHEEVDISPVKETILMLYNHKITLKKQPITEQQKEGVAGVAIEKYSSLQKLLRVTAAVIKAAMLFAKRKLKINDSEILLAKRFWIRWDQDRVYALQGEVGEGKPMLLNNIRVFRDEYGIIRCHTRMQNASMPQCTKTPILLVKKSTLTRLIVLNIHYTHMHAGTAHTLANIRKKFWLPQGRREVYHIILHHCFVCRRHVAQPYVNPDPPQLPDFRVAKVQKPFQAVGVDVMGPCYVKQVIKKTQKEKVWIVLFTCAVVRAVHLELLSDMTTQEMTYAFRRFFARRGVPKIVISDNAPQFHALDGYLVDIWKTLAQKPAISAYFATHQITWKFIPELSPWMGGMYERMMKNVKTALEKTYGNKVVQKQQFECTVIEIEAMINARPISYVDRHLDTPIITPIDFLTATFVAVPINTEIKQQDNTLVKLWKSSQQYLDQFWQQWADHYLLLLRERNDQLKKQTRSTPYKPTKGDIVIMVEPTKRRSAWQMAVVERTIPGSDNQIRAVQIRIPNGARLIRPVVALAPLHLNMDLPHIEAEQLNVNSRTITLRAPDGPSEDFADSPNRVSGESVSASAKSENKH